ncbi:nucleoplasmin-like [Varanus komodoensis]|uniref:nucleoplasmin-like n=1 Tax=Varanus komodoensis TaxID=61221 RepID=UPI001CF7CF95|nr:nucleoplasmin-like [Varanus komodoensis]
MHLILVDWKTIKGTRADQVSLGEDADDVPHVVAVESRNMASILKPIPIVSLKHSALPMVSLDGFEFIPPVSFILNSGTGPVYLNGQHLILGEDSDYEPSEGDAPEDMDTGEGSYEDVSEAKAEAQAEETSSER